MYVLIHVEIVILIYVTTEIDLYKLHEKILSDASVMKKHINMYNRFDNMRRNHRICVSRNKTLFPHTCLITVAFHTTVSAPDTARLRKVSSCQFPRCVVVFCKLVLCGDTHFYMIAEDFKLEA